MKNHTDTIRDTMFTYFSGDIRRINHFLKVTAFAMHIGRLEGLSAEALEILELTALVHDCGIKNSELKYHSSAGTYQQIEGPPVVREMFARCGISETITERVAFIVGHHHTYSAINGKDFQILVEADFLVNIDEDAMEQAAIESVLQKIFVTETGKRTLKQLYMNV